MEFIFDFIVPGSIFLGTFFSFEISIIVTRFFGYEQTNYHSIVDSLMTQKIEKFAQEANMG